MGPLTFDTDDSILVRFSPKKQAKTCSAAPSAQHFVDQKSPEGTMAMHQVLLHHKDGSTDEPGGASQSKIASFLDS